MNGFIEVNIPESCKECQFFDTILDKPLTITYSEEREEIESGACKCQLSPDHRLKPMDNGEIMELITIKDSGRVHTESTIHHGRPKWCKMQQEGIDGKI